MIGEADSLFCQLFLVINAVYDEKLTVYDIGVFFLKFPL